MCRKFVVNQFVTLSPVQIRAGCSCSVFCFRVNSLLAMSGKENKRPRNVEDRAISTTGIVKLNVGGKEFQTSRATLVRNSAYFDCLFAFGKQQLDDKGCIFVDRCPKLWSIVLHSFRTFARPTQSAIDSYKQPLLDECAFYGCEWLSRKIEGKISSIDVAPRYRIDDEDAQLLDVFEWACDGAGNRSPGELQIPLLLTGQGKRFAVDCPDAKTFEERLDEFSGDIFSALKEKCDCRGMIVAGGSILATLSGDASAATDIDIFLVCDDPEEARAKLRCIFEACRDACRKKSQAPQSQYRRTMLVTRTACSVTILSSAVPRPPAVQVILHTYSTVFQVLARFDVDCCGVAFDLGDNKVLATRRCVRALAHGVNVMDSRHHSQMYCQRLEKYAYRHGFSIGVPGFRPELVTEKILLEKYVYVQDRDLLVKIDQYGMPSGGRATACFLDKATSLQYAMAHLCSVVDGLKRLLVWDGYNKGAVSIRHARAPSYERPCRGEASPNTVVVKSACAPGTFYLLWGTSVPEDSDEELDATRDRREGVSDLDGYHCTPIERANALFDRLLDENLLTEQQADGGAVTKLLNKTMERQNGHVSSQTAARHLDDKWRGTERLSFVFDFVPCETATFEELSFVHDAGRAPLHQLDDAGFELMYGLPRRLRFPKHRPREPLEQDLLSAVY